MSFGSGFDSWPIRFVESGFVLIDRRRAVGVLLAMSISYGMLSLSCSACKTGIEGVVAMRIIV